MTHSFCLLLLLYNPRVKQVGRLRGSGRSNALCLKCKQGLQPGPVCKDNLLSTSTGGTVTIIVKVHGEETPGVLAGVQ